MCRIILHSEYRPKNGERRITVIDINVVSPSGDLGLTENTNKT